MLFRKLVHTTNDHALMILRGVLGIVFFAHGAQKVLGWFGGSGYAETMGMFTRNLGCHEFLAALAIWTECLGGLARFAGFLSRIAGLGIAIEMAVAVYMVHFRNG